MTITQFSGMMWAMRDKRTEKIRVTGRVGYRHIVTRYGVPAPATNSPAQNAQEKNLVVDIGRAQLAKLLRGRSSVYVDRIQLGDCRVGGVVRKTDFPADRSDTHLVHEIRDISGAPGATFDLDSDSSPDEIVKVDQSVGTPGTLTTGNPSLLTDVSGVDFLAEGVDVKDTVTVMLNGQDYTLGILAVISATQIEVYNPGNLAGAVGYRVHTPGTQALFQKLVSGDNFPADRFGPRTIVHEAALMFSDGSIFNRITFVPNDNSLGLTLQPTDIDGTRIDVQFDWTITF